VTNAYSISDSGEAQMLPAHEQEALVALWNSLAAAIRAELVESQSSGSIATFSINDPLPQELSSSTGGKLLSIWLDVYSGRGSWNCISRALDMAEHWTMAPSGVVELDGETLNLSTAAKRFVEKITGQWTGPHMA
jgi:hypothetical protein